MSFWEGNNSKIITVTSSSDQDGKTFTAVGLAETLAEFSGDSEGNKPFILLVEANPGHPSLKDHYDVGDDIYNLKNALGVLSTVPRDSSGNFQEGELYIDAVEFIRKCCFFPRDDLDNFAVIASESFSEDELKDADETLFEIFAEILRELADLIILDCGSSPEIFTMIPSLKAADQILMVVNCQKETEQNLSITEGFLKALGCERKTAFVLNCWDPDLPIPSFLQAERKVLTKLPLLHRCSVDSLFTMPEQAETLYMKTAFAQLANHFCRMNHYRMLLQELIQLEKGLQENI